MQSVYLETSVFGYLASRPSGDLVIAGNQKVTNDWWAGHRFAYRLFVSRAVVVECSAGDPQAAEERLAYLKKLRVLEVCEQAEQLAKALLAEAALPPKAAIDALHIALAAANQIDYLLTWNCKHIANPTTRRMIERVLNSEKATAPIICTPQELIYA